MATIAAGDIHPHHYSHGGLYGLILFYSFYAQRVKAYCHTKSFLSGLDVDKKGISFEKLKFVEFSLVRPAKSAETAFGRRRGVKLFTFCPCLWNQTSNPTEIEPETGR